MKTIRLSFIGDLRRFYWLPVLLYAGTAVAGSSSEAEAGADAQVSAPPLLTVVFTAETHAALLPCDCPAEALGGVARRATVIAQLRRRGPVLLVDAGGWAAGGLYDELGDGDPERDKLRTRLTARAMELMNYDAVAAGDEELPYLPESFFQAGTTAWRFPVLAANIVPSAPPRQGAASGPRGFLRFDFPDLRVVVGGLTTDEDLSLTRDNSLKNYALLNPSDPATLKRLDEAWATLGGDGALRVLLAHVGEEVSTSLAARADLVVNAHRKSGARDSFAVKGGYVVNFDFESRRLGAVEVYRRAPRPPSGSPWLFRLRYIPLDSTIPDDPEVAALTVAHTEALKRTDKKRLNLEYWTMSYCPGCVQTNEDVAAVTRALAERVDFSPRFLVELDENGALRASRGEEELRENKIQALVWRHYPDKFWDWLAWRAEHREAEWTEGAKALGLLAARLRGALAVGEGDALLKRDALLARRRRIGGTPTLVVGNQIYVGETQTVRLQSALCGMLGAPKPEACRDVPACFFDAQCRKRGYVGRCVNAGEPNARCEYAPAVSVEAVVLHDPDALGSNYERICEVLTHDLPGLKPRVISAFSPEGQRLAEELKITRLPAYLLDPAARKEKGFVENLGGVTEKRGAFLLVKPETTGANRLTGRRRIFGRADLFAARFSKAGQEAVATALACVADLPPDARPWLVFHDVIYWAETVGEDGKKRREPAAPGGVAELEEAARTAVVAASAPDKLNAYLLKRGERRGSSYWDQPLRDVGLDPETIRRAADPPSPEIQKKLEAAADLIRELNAPGAVFLLAENCELLPLPSAKELAARLAQIGRRGAERVETPRP